MTFKVGDFVYAWMGSHGSFYGRLVSIDLNSAVPYEVKIFYYADGKPKKDHNRYWTSEIKLANDAVYDEIEILQEKINRLRAMNRDETVKDLEAKYSLRIGRVYKVLLKYSEDYTEEFTSRYVGTDEVFSHILQFEDYNCNSDDIVEVREVE